MENNTVAVNTFQSFEVELKGMHPSFVPVGQEKSARKSSEYTETLKEFHRVAAKYSADRIYLDFVKIYDATGFDFNPETMKMIAGISRFYGNDAGTMNYLFTFHYFAMLSEQTGREPRLGKRIRRLVVYQALFNKDATPITYSPPRKWWLLDAQCRQLGF